MAERLRAITPWIVAACLLVAFVAVVAPGFERSRPVVATCLLAIGALMAMRWLGQPSRPSSPRPDRPGDRKRLLSTIDRELARAARAGAATTVVKAQAVDADASGGTTALVGALRDIVRTYDAVVEVEAQGEVFVIATIEDQGAARSFGSRIASTLGAAAWVSAAVTADRSEPSTALLDRLEPTAPTQVGIDR